MIKQLRNLFTLLLLTVASVAWADGVYKKITSTNDLASGKYLIVCEEVGKVFNGSLTTLDATANGTSVSISSDKTIPLKGSVQGSADFDLSDKYFEYDATNKTLKSASGYYIGQTKNDNGIASSKEKSYENSITFGTNGDATIACKISTNTVSIKYNKTSGQNRFRYYKSTSSQTAVQLYKYVEIVDENLADPQLSFGETTAFTVNKGDDFTAPTLTKAEGFDGTVKYQSSDEDVALVDETTGEVLIGGEGIATITASSAATDNFRAGEASYTITVVDNSPVGLAAFLALADGTTKTLSLNVAQVIYQNGDNMYVRDGDDAIEFYKSGLEWETGLLLSGTLTATKSSFNKNPQAKDIADVNVETADTEDITAVATTIAEAKNHLNDLVEFTFDQFTTSSSNYYATDGTNRVLLYDKFKINYDAPESGKTYTVKGIMIAYNSTIEICPIEALTEVVVPVVEHTVSFSVNGEVTSTADVAEKAAITFPENPADINGKTFVGWTTTTIDGTTDEKPDFVTSATMGTEDVTYYAVFAKVSGDVSEQTATLTSEQIKDSYNNSSSYGERTFTDGNGKAWKAYAMSGQHSKATSDYYYAQIKKSDNSQAYYIQVPEYGTITKLVMTVSSTQKPKDDGGNNATLYFSANNNTAAAGEGVVSDTEDKEVSLDCSSLKLKTGYITAGGAVRIWNITVTYVGSGTYSNYCTTVPAETVSIPVNADFPGTTFSTDKALDFTDVEGITAYIITDAKGTTVPVTKVPANTGLYLEVAETAAEKREFEVPVISEADDLAEVNLLIPTDGTPVQSNDATTYYAYGKQNGKYAFFKVSATKPYTPSANKALLAVPVAEGSAKEMIEVNGGTTTIETIDNSQLTIDNGIYNLAGQRVTKAQKGVYIVGGKKVVIR